MPIDIEEFESASDEELMENGPSVRDQVLEFLSYNPEQAYSREEIQSAIDADAIALVHALTDLERDGTVRHRGRYWAISEDYETAGDMTFGEPL